jgi:hypothetical protein
MGKATRPSKMETSTKGCTKTETPMAMDSILGKTVPLIREISSEDFEKEQAHGLMRRETSIRGTSKKTKRQEMGPSSGLMAISTKGSSKTT